MSLPLRVFEQRYRVMTRELLASGGVFGVLLIREGREVGGGAVPHDIGTTARIESCQELEGGRFNLTARGVHRFRVTRMLPPRPYPYGEIELFDDRIWDIEPRLERALETVRATFPVYFRLALSLTDQWARGLTLPRDAHDVVNFLAPWLQVGEETRQRLLEVEGAPERVALLAEVLDELLGKTRDDVAVYHRRKYRGLGIAN